MAELTPEQKARYIKYYGPDENGYLESAGGEIDVLLDMTKHGMMTYQKGIEFEKEMKPVKEEIYELRKVKPPTYLDNGEKDILISWTDTHIEILDALENPPKDPKELAKLERLIDLSIKLWGNIEPDIARPQARKGEFLIGQGRLDDAEKFLQELEEGITSGVYKHAGAVEITVRVLKDELEEARKGSATRKALTTMRQEKQEPKAGDVPVGMDIPANRL